MATDGHGGSTAGRTGADGRPRILFGCHGCGVRFPDDPTGPGCCPRCGAIGGHERLGRPSECER